MTITLCFYSLWSPILANLAYKYVYSKAIVALGYARFLAY